MFSNESENRIRCQNKEKQCELIQERADGRKECAMFGAGNDLRLLGLAQNK